MLHEVENLSNMRFVVQGWPGELNTNHYVVTVGGSMQIAADIPFVSEYSNFRYLR